MKKLIAILTCVCIYATANAQDAEGMITFETADSEVKIHITGTSIATIDWGDGTIVESNIEDIWGFFNGDQTHYYHNSGTYTITIIGANITYLNCSKNQLTSLDVSKNPALKELFCENNQLTKLDVSKNPKLERLHCYINRLTSLDVSKNTELTELVCVANQLTSLDVSKNTELTRLICSGNQLTNLDVSKNTALERLYCSYNQLKKLDVSKNTKITLLSCCKNNFSETALGKLFRTLHSNLFDVEKIISIGKNNMGIISEKSIRIAQERGWRIDTLRCEDDEGETIDI